MSATKSETAWSKEFPSVDGYYWYRWNSQTALFQVYRGKTFTTSGGEQHPPLKNAEWLGPISSADFEQLAALREAAMDAIKVLDMEFQGSLKRKAAIAALRNALDPTGRG